MRVVILTGAGISAESGIPTFRTATGNSPGLWEEHDIDDVATVDGYTRNPRLVHDFYTSRRDAAAAAEPNAAHIAVAELAKTIGDRLLVVTQNIDDLHERAGLPECNLIHMHGSLAGAFCTDCGHRVHGGVYGALCGRCGEGALRPDVVWFGERPYEMAYIERAVANCDLFIAIGTSGEVYPAAGLVGIAGANGARTVEMNLTATAQTFDTSIIGPATRTVPQFIADRLR